MKKIDHSWNSLGAERKRLNLVYTLVYFEKSVFRYSRLDFRVAFVPTSLFPFFAAAQ